MAEIMRRPSILFFQNYIVLSFFLQAAQFKIVESTSLQLGAMPLCKGHGIHIVTLCKTMEVIVHLSQNDEKNLVSSFCQTNSDPIN